MEEKVLVKIEESAMTLDAVVAQVSLIQKIMKTVMKEDEHYGVIPGTTKPTLYKPGAEKLCLTFRLEPDYEIVREVREKDFIAYTVKCRLHPMEVTGIGSCNSRETKYRYHSQSTGKPVPKEYWDNRDSAILGGPQYTTRKKDGRWVIYEQVENENPWDLDNTLIKMACKRSLVAATLNATAASDIFTQDIEDMPSDIVNGEVVEEKPKKDKKAPPKSKKGPQEATSPNGEGIPTDDNGKVDKGKVLRNTLRQYGRADNETYFKILGKHGATDAEQIIDTFSEDQQKAVLRDLEKEIAL